MPPALRGTDIAGRRACTHREGVQALLGGGAAGIAGTGAGVRLRHATSRFGAWLTARDTGREPGRGRRAGALARGRRRRREPPQSLMRTKPYDVRLRLPRPSTPRRATAASVQNVRRHAVRPRGGSHPRPPRPAPRKPSASRGPGFCHAPLPGVGGLPGADKGLRAVEGNAGAPLHSTLLKGAGLDGLGGLGGLGDILTLGGHGD
mmetsp:Transcript_64910/g.205053  ORF Transcript_64910/g.205053 Transcript_64910/m.205053 type:complete len:205 (-) Transcript_64910:48-662(-)